RIEGPWLVDGPGLLIDIVGVERALELLVQRAALAVAADAAAGPEAQRLAEVAAAALAVERLLDRAQAGGIQRRRIVDGRRLQTLDDLGGIRRLLGLGLDVLLLLGGFLLFLLLLGGGGVVAHQLHLLEGGDALVAFHEEQPTEEQDAQVEDDRTEDT